MPVSIIDASTGNKPNNDSHQAVDHSPSSPSTEDAPQMTEHLNEPPRKRPGKRPRKLEIDIKLPQEILDMIWEAALEPWLKNRVIILDCTNKAEHGDILNFVLECTNPINDETSELPGNIRLVDSRARSTVKLFSSMIARDMFPERPHPSRRHLGQSFRAQHADFQHDIFWLSRVFIDSRFQYIRFDRDGCVNRAQFTRDAPQPSHMMLGLRHMLAIMQMVYIRDTPCLGRRQDESRGSDNPIDDFHRIVQISNSGRLRTLTVLLPQGVDEWSGKVDYEVLEHRPFGTSVEEKASVLELARNQTNRSHLEQIYNYWSDLISRAENRGYQLPFLQFSRRRQW